MRAQDGDSPSNWKAAPHVLAAARRALDLILPPTTLDGAAAPHGPGLSADAWARIAFIEAPVCDGCGVPFEHDLGEGVLCPACDGAKRRSLSRVRAACLYDEHSRDLILPLKHGDRTDLAPLLARWLSRAAGPLLAEADLVVPVPLHRWRLLRRRYNQAAEIARPLARRAGLAFVPEAVVRVRDTGSQAGKSAGGRRRNLAAAFAAPAALRSRLAGKRVLLVDDVMTTGATLEGCARALRRAGASQVDAVVVARVKERPS